ncbi:hypothetical protein [Natrinema pallidum]|uniref:Uncharacterized protein n=1 Tax=Natrinema pallidum DSM 3751 TaxID=1227495 RepID=L9YK01_9EURY|nr:hypothetical protein [Natrinema pallidum]ELY73263.1 hypothetical protein C487_17715 [Natrinema pallidum DSM 3751]
MTVYCGPAGRLRDADREREIIRMALADACGFEYYAPDELAYDGDGPDWWAVFWQAIERQYDETVATGQRSLEDFAAAGGASP